MTNFEHMRERVLDTVSALDEEELRQLVSDTCMDAGREEGIFGCGLCEEAYGCCDSYCGGDGCMQKYLGWCAQEYGHGPGSAREDKKAILMRLEHLLRATRAGSSVRGLVLSEDGRWARILFVQGSRDVCVEGDSGRAMIMDVLRAL